MSYLGRYICQCPIVYRPSRSSLSPHPLPERHSSCDLPRSSLPSCCFLIWHTDALGKDGTHLSPPPSAYLQLAPLNHDVPRSHDKQRARAERIASLPEAYRQPLTAQDRDILARPVAAIVAGVQTASLDPSDVLAAYAKRALQAHAQTNCLTEILSWGRDANRAGPLAGVPVSLKDTLAVKGYDSTIGYSAMAGKPMAYDGAFVKLLRDAGAVPFVKTNVPTTMLSFESTNDVFGRTENPHKKGYSPGGSSGGESALLALGGSRIGVGTDVAGSVRVPSHYSGVYAIKSSMHRFIKTGGVSSMPGQEGVPATCNPMAKTLEDLETFWRAVFQMKPWEYDHSVSILYFLYCRVYIGS